MYDPQVSDRQIATAAQALREEFARQGLTYRVQPERHSVQDCQRNARHLAELINLETGRPVRDLYEDEREWIINERLVCQWDAHYWCNPPEAPIWMTDGTFKPIGDIKPGDTVIGWSLPGGKDQYARSKFQPSLVQSVARRIAPIVKVTMRSGRVIRCTPDHLWANGAGWRQRCYWTKAKPGALLRRVIDPIDAAKLSFEQQKMAAWLAGIYDGEGCTPRGSRTVRISQYRGHNPGVHAEISRALFLLGVRHTFDDEGFCMTSRQDVLDFYLLTRPVRGELMRDVATSGQVTSEIDEIVSVEPDGEGEVVSMQTSTGNYVAWGYLSKNCTHYACILNWENQIALYSPSIAQRIIWDIQAEMERNGFSIMIQQLKARQLGVSTDTELKVAHRVQFHPYVNAVVASARPDKSLKMAAMMERCWEHQPWFLVPARGSWSTGDVPGIMEFGALHSQVSIQHGTQKMGIARGDTPTVGHLSEVAEFENPEDLIEAALLNAVHESPWVFMVFEGTGAGKHNWWYRNWQFIKANWPVGKSRLRPVFLPWYVGIDIYPTKTWLLMHPMPRDWQPEDATAQHARKAKEYVEHNDLMRKYLGNGWEMPREQMWWWEVTKAEHKAKGTLSTFFSELCADDIEAFTSQGNAVCDAEIITTYRDRMSEPIGVFGLKGPVSLIPQKFQPAKWEINAELPAIPIDKDLTLVPLRYQGISTVDPTGKIFIWEFPDDNEEYGLGVDTCNGVGADRGVVEVLRKGTVQKNDAQVAEWVNPWLNGLQMLPWVHALGKFYSRKERQAKLVIEQTCGGNILQLELRKMGWRNFHVDLRGYDQKVLDRGKSPNIGWHMHGPARDALITKLLDYLRNSLIDINSPWFVEEMGDLQANELTQKIAAERGAHDDRIMSIGMVLVSLHDLEIRTKLPSIAKQRAEAMAEDVPAPRYIAGWQEIPGPHGTAPVFEVALDMDDLEDAWSQ